MRAAATIVVAVVLAAASAAGAQERPRDPVRTDRAGRQAVWVYFKDKGPAAEAMTLAARTVNARAPAGPRGGRTPAPASRTPPCATNTWPRWPPSRTGRATCRGG